MKIVLASKSPRRKELLSLITQNFDIRPSDFDEENISTDSPKELVSILAKGKAEAVLRNSGEIVIGCDTVVALENEVLGKPADKSDAYRMISLLSGKTHSVFSGVHIISDEGECTFAEETKVTFFPLTEKETEEYINTDEPYDKAGAYGIQGKAGLFVEKIEGDYNNVVGLPIARLKRELEKLLKTAF